MASDRRQMRVGCSSGSSSHITSTERTAEQTRQETQNFICSSSRAPFDTRFLPHTQYSQARLTACLQSLPTFSFSLISSLASLCFAAQSLVHFRKHSFSLSLSLNHSLIYDLRHAAA